MKKSIENISLKWVSPFWYLGCDQNCKECFIGKKSKKIAPLNIRKKTIDILAKNNTEEIFLCGGNPILDPFIEETVAYIKTKGILVELLSNSWDIDKNKFIKNKKKFLVNIDDKAATFWGGDAKTHDKICGCDGSFLRLIKNLKEISQQGHSIDCILNVTSQNKNNIYQIIKKLKNKINITKVWLQRIFPYGNALQNDLSKIELKPEDFNSILKQLVMAQKDFNLIDISFDSTPPFCMVNKKYHQFLERYKRGLSFWALDYKCRLFGESFDVINPKFALLNKKPIYKVNDLINKIKKDSKTQDILEKKYLPKKCQKCQKCKINDCFGGYLIRNAKGLTVDPILGLSLNE
ncbi:MAG: 4Fe-4S cluster-binding domain-containing protein [bacterium]|nr:4Fe-4S cluster-binding domain-containing protein [bacterium]